MNKKKSTAYWNNIFKNFEDSNLGINPFCRENWISSSQFHYWKKLLGYKCPTVIKDKVSSQNFISVEQKVKTTSTEVTFTISGHKITFSELPEPSWIAKFAKELSHEASAI